jgi:hypothetical protein
LVELSNFIWNLAYIIHAIFIMFVSLIYGYLLEDRCF